MTFQRGMNLAFSSGGGSRCEGGWLLRGAQLLKGGVLVFLATSYRHVDLGTRYARVTQESRVCRVKKERVAMIVRGGQLLVSSLRYTKSRAHVIEFLTLNKNLISLIDFPVQVSLGMGCP